MLKLFVSLTKTTGYVMVSVLKVSHKLPTSYKKLKTALIAQQNNFMAFLYGWVLTA